MPDIPDTVFCELSANTPCIGGIIDPPNIIIINNDDPWLVYLPKPAMAKAKMDGHMIEQHKPPLIMANIPMLPVVNKPITKVAAPNNPNRVNVRTGF